MNRNHIFTPVLALAGMAVLLLCPALLGQTIPDPGEPTILEFESAQLMVGESRPIPINIFNDEAIERVMLRFNVQVLEGDLGMDPTDYVHFDSVSYFLFDHDIDSLTLDSRWPVEMRGNQLGDGVDTIDMVMSCSDYPHHVPLYPGIHAFFAVFWFTGVTPGSVKIELCDSTSARFYPDGNQPPDDPYFVPEVRYPDAGQVYQIGTGEPSIVCRDLGAQDSIWLIGNEDGYPLGESMPVTVRLKNDEALNSFESRIGFGSSNNTAIRIDSVCYVGQLVDPSVLSVRFPVWIVDNVLPDTAGAHVINGSGRPLMPGDDPVLQIFVTAVAEADVLLVGVCHGQAVCPGGTAYSFDMPWDSLVIHVGESVAPAPVFAPIDDPDPVVSGSPVGFLVGASSPVSNPLAVTLESLYLYDSLYGEPVSQPSFSAGFFMWTPAPDDVGIWKATFSALDQVSGRSTETYAVIQVVSSSEYLLSCQTVETPDALQANDIVHGDYDQDGSPEILVAGEGWVTTLTLALYEHFGSGQLQAGFTQAKDHSSRGLVTGYINEDDYLDAVYCLWREVWVLLGDGNGGFTVLDADVAISGGMFMDGVLLNFNGDAYLDYAVMISPGGGGEDGLIRVYTGGAGGVFTKALSFNVSAPGLTVGSSDLNNDGLDDLIAGTYDGLEVYLNSGAGSYALSYSDNCNLGAADIDITNQGADFNGDGIFDLCIAAPGTGGNVGLSDLMIYLGQGDGTFIGQPVRMLYGTVSGVRAGDFNGDGLLDIAFINSTEAYLEVLFGDEAGVFRNQIRYEVPEYFPRELDCVDIDTDGDLDLVVSSYVFASEELKSSLFVFVNELDPVGAVSSSMRVDAFDNVDVEMVAPNGARLNKVSNSLPSASLYRRDLNGNSDLDAEIVASAVSSGAHLLKVSPRPNALPGETFSLDFSPCYKTTHQLVRDLPVPSEEYVFPIFPDGVSLISPFQGKRLQGEHPTFEWDFMGTSIQMQSSLPFSDRGYDFRLAHDPAFENIIETASIDDNRYTLQASLSVEGLTSYFWQIRPAGQTDWSGIFVFHVIPPTPDQSELVDVSIAGAHDEEGDGNTAGTGGEAPDPGDAGEEDPDAGPVSFALRQNYPNPFNPTTGIPYSLPRSSYVKLEVFNVLGRLVTTLVDEQQGAGNYQAFWNASELSSGIYLYRLTTDEFTATKKMLLVK